MANEWPSPAPGSASRREDGISPGNARAEHPVCDHTVQRPSARHHFRVSPGGLGVHGAGLWTRVPGDSDTHSCLRIAASPPFFCQQPQDAWLSSCSLSWEHNEHRPRLVLRALGHITESTSSRRVLAGACSSLLAPVSPVRGLALGCPSEAQRLEGAPNSCCP